MRAQKAFLRIGADITQQPGETRLFKAFYKAQIVLELLTEPPAIAGVFQFCA